MALYRAKAEGRGAFRFFEAEMDARMQARRRLELDLRQALARGEFELHYQPIVNVEPADDDRGFEALMRWHHPERGLVSPAEFIPLAEEIGLIVPIGEWVLRQACRDAANWPDEIRVAVNLSPVQFKNATLLEAVITALGAEPASPPQRLELEITEGVLLIETRGDARACCISCARSACGSRWTISAPAIPVAELSAQLPVRQDQDRRLVHPQHPDKRQLARDHPRGDRPGRQPRHGDHRRGRGDGRAARAPAPEGCSEIQGRSDQRAAPVAAEVPGLLAKHGGRKIVAAA